MYLIGALFAMLALAGGLLLGMTPSKTAHYDSAAQVVSLNLIRNFVLGINQCGVSGVCAPGAINLQTSGTGFQTLSDGNYNISTDGLGDVLIVWNNDPALSSSYDYLSPQQIANNFASQIPQQALQNIGGSVYFGLLYNNTIIGVAGSGITNIPSSMFPSLYDATPNHSESANGAAVILYTNSSTVAQVATPSAPAPSPMAPTAIPASSPVGSSEASSSSSPPTVSLTVQNWWPKAYCQLFNQNTGYYKYFLALTVPSYYQLHWTNQYTYDCTAAKLGTIPVNVAP